MKERTDIAGLYRQFCRESFDERGTLQGFEPVYEDSFNFAYDVVDEIARLEPERRAMLWVSDAGEERTFTFGEIRRLSDQAANLFRSRGVRRGDRVMLMLKRHYQFWYCQLALHKIGAVAISSSSLLTKQDLLYRFQAAEVSYLVCTPDGTAPQAAEDACREYDGIRAKFMVNGPRSGWIDLDEELNQQPLSWERVATRAEDPLLIYFTSGTAGNPKMAWHDHTYPIGHIISARYWQGIGPDGLHLTVADTGWAKASWGKIYGPWFLGASVFVYDFSKYSSANLLEILGHYGVTSFCAPPTIYRYLLRERLERYDLSRVRHAATAGEFLSAEVYQRFYQATGLQIMEAFGQSETAAVTLNLTGTPPRPGSMGKASPLYDVDLVDSDGHSVSAGEIGELVLRVPQGKTQVGLFRGYHCCEELTREVWHDGLYHTGDTAWRDEEGYFWYVSRVDDVIKASGYRIGPYEIESVLQEHPAVAECAVTAAPDSIRGAVVKATVVLAHGCAPSRSLARELQRHVKERTAPYKYPRLVEFVEELPKTFSGKIKRAEIRRRDQMAPLSLETGRRQGA